jgi:hypothetical protein
LRSNPVEFEVVTDPIKAGFRLTAAPVTPPIALTRITVRVLDERGQPFPDGFALGLGPLTRNPDGSFGREIPPGHYEVRAGSRQGADLGSIKVRLAAADERTLTFRAQGFGSLRVALTGDRDRALVELRLYPGQRGTAASVRQLNLWGTFYSPEPEGTRFPAVPVGSYTLVIVHRLEQVSVSRRLVEARLNEERTVTVDLSEEATPLADE